MYHLLVHPLLSTRTAAMVKAATKRAGNGSKMSKKTSASYRKPQLIDKRIKPVEQKCLDNLRMMRDVLKAKDPVQRRQLAHFAGYESHTQQGFGLVLRNNAKKGLIELPSKDTVQLTDAGYMAAGEIDSPPPSNDGQVHQFLMADIPPSFGKVFSVSLFPSIGTFCNSIYK